MGGLFGPLSLVSCLFCFVCLLLLPFWFALSLVSCFLGSVVRPACVPPFLLDSYCGTLARFRFALSVLLSWVEK